MELNRQTLTATQTATESEVKQEKVSLEDFPRLEDLLKSEKEIKSAQTQTLQGLKQVQPGADFEHKTFAKKEDKHKEHAKKRIKLLTSVYAVVATLLFVFVGINAITLAVLSKDINSNTETIQNMQYDLVDEIQNATPEAELEGPPMEVVLNVPRDYDDDQQELTFLDKLTIVFRNLFG